MAQRETKFVLTASDKTKVAVKSAQNGLGKLNNSVGLLTAGFAGLAGAGGIGYFIVKQAEAAKQALAYSQALGVSTEALTSWQYAAQDVGIEGDKIADIFKDVSEKIGDAFINKGGEAKEALDNLGLSAAAMNSLAPDQQLLAIANALGGIQTQGEKVQIMESLANDASLLLPLLANDSEQLKALVAEAGELGVVLSEVDAQKLKEADASIKKLSGAMAGLGLAISREVSAPLSRVINKIAVLIPEAVNKLTNSLNESSKISILDEINKREQKLNQLQAERTDIYAEHKQIIDNGLFNVLGYDAVNEKIEIHKKSIYDLRESYDELSSALLVTVPLDNKQDQGLGDVAATGLDDTAQKELEKLQTKYADEHGLLLESFNVKQLLIDDALLVKEIGEQEHLDLMFSIESEFQEKLTALHKKGQTERQKFSSKSGLDQTKQVLGDLTNITSGIAHHNKTAFELNKVASISNAVISTYEGVNKTLGAYPQPLAGILAAGHLAAGLAQVSAIKATSFGGTGGGANLPGAPSVPSDVLPKNDSPQETTATTQKNELVIRLVGGGDAFTDAVVESIEKAESNDQIRIIRE